MKKGDHLFISEQDYLLMQFESDNQADQGSNQSSKRGDKGKHRNKKIDLRSITIMHPLVIDYNRIECIRSIESDITEDIRIMRKACISIYIFWKNKVRMNSKNRNLLIPKKKTLMKFFDLFAK